MRSPTLSFGRSVYVAKDETVTDEFGVVVATTIGEVFARRIAAALNIIPEIFKAEDREEMDRFDEAFDRLRSEWVSASEDQ